MSFPFNIRVYGALVHNGRLLLSDERIEGRLITKLPGGGLEFGEGTRACVEREFLEETGLYVVAGDHLYTTDFFLVSAFNPRHQIVSIYYQVVASNLETLHTSTNKWDFAEGTSEAQSLRWIDLDLLNEDDFTFPIDRLLVSVFKGLGQ